MVDDTRPDDEIIATIGGLVDESSVTLAVYGHDLDPEDVSSRLGCEPSSCHRRGDRKSPQGVPARTGAWFLNLRGFAPTGPEELIRRLLMKLPPDKPRWQELVSKFDVQLRIAIHFTAWNKGFELSPEVVSDIGKLGARVDFDLYAYGDDDA